MSASHYEFGSNDRNNNEPTQKKQAQIKLQIQELNKWIDQLKKLTQEAKKEKFSLEQELSNHQNGPFPLQKSHNNKEVKLEFYQ